MDPSSGAADRTLTRRALLRARLGRADGDHVEADGPARRPARRLVTAGEADATRLAPALAGIAAHVIALGDLPDRARVLAVAAGDGTPLVEALARAGHAVTAAEADPALARRGAGRLPAVTWHVAPATRMPVDASAFDAVLAWFGAAYEPDCRAVARELRRTARPGARMVLAAWAGQPWSRYETAYRHLFDLPDLDVEEAAVGGRAYALVVARCD